MKIPMFSSSKHPSTGAAVRVLLPVLALGLILGCGGTNKATAPTITSFTPTSGTYDTSVVVTGTGFTNGVKNFYFGGVGVTSNQSQINSDTQATIYVPPAAVTGPITVVATGGTGTSPSYFYVQPTVSTFPTNGVPGSTVTITGNGLLGVYEIQFGLTSPTVITASEFQTDTEQQITFTIPGAASSGNNSYILELDWGFSPITEQINLS